MRILAARLSTMKDQLKRKQKRKKGWFLKLIFAGTATVVAYQFLPYMAMYRLNDPSSKSDNLLLQSVSLLQVKDPLFKRMGTSRLAHFAVDDERRTKIVEIGGAQELLNMLGTAKDVRTRKEALRALDAMSKSVKPDSIVICPPTPVWKPDAGLDLNGDGAIDKDDDVGVCEITIVGENHEILMKNDDILGDGIPFEQECALRQVCYQLLKLPIGKNKNLQFPGSHPVSLNHENIQLLKQRVYYATWKADGTRYMMLITNKGSYLIDRNFRFRRVQLRFPCRHSDGCGENTHHLTLLDGEMIIDTIPGSGEQIRRYLIFDIMAINSISFVERPFCERWEMIEKEVIKPRNYEWNHIQESQNPHYRYDLEAFRLRRKDFWLLNTVNSVLKDFIPKLLHAADGLIFQAWFDPYVPRTHEGLLKWKYAEMNSVDFLFEMVGHHQQLYLHERGKKKLMGAAKAVFNDGSSPSLYSGKIIECSWNSEHRVWSFMRIRSDKATPNDYHTFLKVMRSIEDNITEEFLVNEISSIGRLPIYAKKPK